MTVDEAVAVAKIMISQKRTPRMVAELLIAFPEVNWTEFFNKLDDHVTDWDHDAILAILEMKRRGKDSGS